VSAPTVAMSANHNIQLGQLIDLLRDQPTRRLRRWQHLRSAAAAPDTAPIAASATVRILGKVPPQPQNRRHTHRHNEPTSSSHGGRAAGGPANAPHADLPGAGGGCGHVPRCDARPPGRSGCAGCMSSFGNSQPSQAS
jgi:hypothetical protein